MHNPTKAPFYVLDRDRQIIVGQFFKLASAQEVHDMLAYRSVSAKSVSIEDSSDRSYIDLYIDASKGTSGSREYKRATEADLQAIQDAKYLPEPRRSWLEHFTIGAVYTVQGDQMVIVERVSNGPKFLTYRAFNLVDGRTWTLKRPHSGDKPKMVRMATPNEWAKAQGRVEELNTKRRERVETNIKHIDIMTLGVGDTITVDYSDVGHRNEVVEAINYKTGRVAIVRRGFAAVRYQKRRFIDAKHIVKIVTKSPYERRNPINDPMWMR